MEGPNSTTNTPPTLPSPSSQVSQANPQSIRNHCCIPCSWATNSGPDFPWTPVFQSVLHMLLLSITSLHSAYSLWSRLQSYLPALVSAWAYLLPPDSNSICIHLHSALDYIHLHSPVTILCWLIASFCLTVVSNLLYWCFGYSSPAFQALLWEPPFSPRLDLSSDILLHSSLWL